MMLISDAWIILQQNIVQRCGKIHCPIENDRKLLLYPICMQQVLIINATTRSHIPKHVLQKNTGWMQQSVINELRSRYSKAIFYCS